MQTDGNVIVLTGRRIDAPDSRDSRFPVENVAHVAEQLQQCFRELRAGLLVCSAANGADLLALQVAHHSGIRTRIVIGGSVADFKTQSVVDRPGEHWGALYDEMIAIAQATDDVIVVPWGRHAEGEMALFDAVNARIIEEARTLSGAERSIFGVAVWDQRSRGEDDVTAAFVERLRAADIPVRHVSPLE
jgi:hypothetical protein